MFRAVQTDELVAFDGSFSIADAPTAPPAGAPGEKRCKEKLQALVEELDDLQHMLYALDQWAVLLVFQAMDAAGKDNTIRGVLTGVNPAGCEVHAFKQPSAEELDHDFLWRTAVRLPQRGRLGVFNRSYYEEVIVVRVHPELLATQKLPPPVDPRRIWQQRFRSIRAHEKHLARNGTIVLKFFLHVSCEEQRRRFLARIEEPEKTWKFSTADVRERRFWTQYHEAYQDALRATSRSWAPWYVIPADFKPYMRQRVAEIVVQSLRTLDLHYPQPGPEKLAELAEMRSVLESEQA
jgi:PPK2 family polyphosphate:nucleotide phosphotransferase